METLTYRLGTLQDLDEITAMIRDAIAEMERHNIHQWDELYPTREDFAEDIRKKTLFTVFSGETLAAIYVISGESDEQYARARWEGEDASSYILHRLCVSPQMQHRGVAKAVLTHIEEQIREMGYRSVRLDTFTENPYAQSLYRHNGYESRGYADWRKGRFDLMEKRLS